LTADPRRFFSDKGNPIACLRAGGLSNYLAAPLALSPLHLLILSLPLPLKDQEAAMLQVTLHVSLILLQLLLIASAESTLLWQLVELPRPVTFLISFGNALLRAIRGGVYLAVIPALMATMVK
jgi:hypothetical protein